VPDIPASDVTTEVRVVWEIFGENGDVWSRSDKPTAEEAIAETRAELRQTAEAQAKWEQRHGPLDPAGRWARNVKLTKIRRCTTIQVTAYSTTYSDEQAITEAADA